MTMSAPTSPHFSSAGFLHRGETNLAAVDDERAAFDGDVALEAAVHRIVLEHVREVVRIEQVVDAHDLDVGKNPLLRAEHHAADATESIDPDLDSHCLRLPSELECVNRCESVAGRPRPGPRGPQ